MGKFVKHEPCPKCGSKDNLARYDNGSAYCFGCKYIEGSTSGNKVNRSQYASSSVVLPTNSTTILGEKAIVWLSQYGISVIDTIRAGLQWDSDRQHLIFPFYDKDNRLCYYTARNFSGVGPKYLGRGSSGEAVSVYQKDKTKPSTQLAITEDSLSAIKISLTGIDAIPALGVNFQTNRILEMSNRGYQKLFVWLDSDKWKEGLDIANRAKWIGMEAKTIRTDEDPKCYTFDSILERLQ